MTRLLAAKAAMLLLILQSSCSLKIDDSIHYNINFQTPPSGDDLITDNEKAEKDENLMKIRTTKNENYVCKLPVFENQNSDGSTSLYSGPSPDAIMTPLYNEKVCSYRIEPYWTYELCHGKYVLQFHEEKDKTSRTEYYLGNMHKDYTTVSSKESMNPPKRMLEGEERPYYSVLYTQGTSCDITGKPRTTNVLYMCNEGMSNKIYSITETSSCNYELIVLTKTLCSHPSYRISKARDHEIVCYDVDGREEPKPLTLLQQEEHQQSTFKREYVLLHTEHEDYGEEVEQAIEAIHKQFQQQQQSFKLGGEKKSSGPSSLASSKPVLDNTVNEILTGNECLVGGQGWWQYEFCYGKKVTQFHQEANGDRVEILLGVFDENVHKAWIDDDKTKRGPKKFQKRINQVSQIYTKGDFCEDAEGHRSVEVRIRCKPTDGSPMAVAIALMEPATCQYILTVEGERFCKPLQHANEYGLIQLEEVLN